MCKRWREPIQRLCEKQRFWWNMANDNEQSKWNNKDGESIETSVFRTRWSAPPSQNKSK